MVVGEIMKKITPQDTNKIIKLYKDGIGSDTIAKQFDVTGTCILKILKKNGIERRNFTRKLGDKHDEIIDLYQRGFSSPEIAEKLNVTHGAILKILKKNNIDRRDNEECRRKYPINKDFFDVIDTEEKAYFLGFLFADGGNIKQANFVRIDLTENDKDILYKLAKLIYTENSEQHVKIQNREDKGSFAYLNINSKYICSQLDKLGCTPKKSLTLKFPELLKDEELIRHFIRGYYDGDGGLNIPNANNRVSTLKIISTLEFCTTIKQFIELKIGTHFCVYNDVPSKNVYTINTSGDRQIRKFLEWLYKNATIYLNRKYELYLKLVEHICETDKLIAAGTQGYSKRYLNT
jgi:predicted DNA-binding protein YlxM (UPF0122 family)